MTFSIRDILLMAGLSLVAILGILLFQDQVVVGVDLMRTYSGGSFAILVAIAVFLIGSIFFVPQWLLIATAIATFGLVEGTGIAWLATMVATTAHVLFARALEGRLRGRLSGKRLDNLRGLFRRNSVQSGFIVRLIPTGPAIIVNAAAGLMGVRRSGFLLGTAFGIIPKIILTAIVASELISSAQSRQVSLGLAFAALSLLLVFLVSRRLRARDRAKGGK